MKDRIVEINEIFTHKRSESAFLRYNTIINDPELKETYTSLEKGIHSTCKLGSKRNFFISVFKEEFLTYIVCAKAAVCDYEGYGPDDSWPPIR